MTSKIEQLVAGYRVVASDRDMEMFERSLDCSIAKRLASIINPNRAGLLDRYIAFIKTE